MEDKDTLKEFNNDLDDLIKDISNPKSLQKIWQTIKKQKDRQPNYQALFNVDKIKIEIDLTKYEDSYLKDYSEFFLYLKQRLEHDFSKIVTVSSESKYILFVRPSIISGREHYNTRINFQYSTHFSLENAVVSGEVLLIDDIKKEIIFYEDLQGQYSAVQEQSVLLSKTEQELKLLALRKFSAKVTMVFTVLFSQALQKNNLVEQGAYLLLKTLRIWGNPPSEVTKGFYFHTEQNGQENVTCIYKYPNDQMAFESDIYDEWGLGLFCKYTIANVLLNLGDIITNLLVNSLKDENMWVKQAAIDVLGALKKTEAADGLISILENDPFLYPEALGALAPLGDHRGQDYFISALKSDSWPIRRIALIGLLRINDKKAIGPIFDLLIIEKKDGIRRIAKKVLRILKDGVPKKRNKIWAFTKRFLSGEDEVDKIINEKMAGVVGEE